MAKKRSAGEINDLDLTAMRKPTTIEEFYERFGNAFVIGKQRRFVFRQWDPMNNLDHATKIMKWVELMSPTWVSTHIAFPVEYNERMFCPAVFDILRDALLLSNSSYAIDAVTVDVNPSTSDMKMACAEGAWAFRQRRSDRLSGASKTAKVAEPLAATAVDLNNTEEIVSLFHEIGNTLKKKTVDGFAQYVISEAVVDPDRGRVTKIRIIVVVKGCLKVDNDAGFYHLCGELAAKVQDDEVVFGIYTDALDYEFVCVTLETTAQGQRRIVRSQRHRFVHFPEPDKPKLQNSALSVLAYIFEMLGIPPTIDMEQEMADKAATLAAGKDNFLRTVREYLALRR